ncbi:hypothetical protein IE9_00058 [Bacillus cereus BAG4X12-1]|nr:hypothetical protein IE9_00058 [Bacillus cereus BAG4X12-1]EOP77916.1 hypothetical protein IEG_05294 [Bacillus cereus BAG5X12-1]QDD81507.1 hypothetical protein FORC087_0204 [Bacillus cereus]SMD33303.1 hypothetical protein SAMN06272738_0095 [Bacillus sp. JKS001846]
MKEQVVFSCFEGGLALFVYGKTKIGIIFLLLKSRKEL